MRFTYCSLFLLFFLTSLDCIAQKWEYPYFFYTKDHGLASNIVYTILKDHDDNLWLGTNAGLQKFDGFNSTLYTVNENLPSNEVFYMLCDQQNRIWLTTFSNQLAFYKNGKIHTRTNDSILAKVETNFNYPIVHEDRNGSIWITSNLSKIIILHKDNSIEYIPNKLKIPTNRAFIEYGDYVYIDEHNSTLRYNLKTRSYEMIKLPHKDLMKGFQKLGKQYFYMNKSNQVKKIIDFEKEGLHFQTGSDFLNAGVSQLLYFDNEGIKVFDTSNLALPKTFFSQYKISSIIEDKNGDFWIGTNGNGIIKASPNTSVNFKQNINETDISLTAIHVDEKYIYTGSSKGQLLVFDKKTKSLLFTKNLASTASQNEGLKKIIKANGTIYALTDKSFYKIDIDKKQITSNRNLKTIFKNIYFENDSLVLLTMGSIYKFKEFNSTHFSNTKINSKRAYSYCTYQGQHLFGTEDSLKCINATLSNYKLNKPISERFIDLKVKDSLLFGCTSENGIYIINGHQIVEHFNKEKGLNSNNCFKILIQKDTVFIATDNGICIYNYKEHAISKIVASDGLANNTVHDIFIDGKQLYATTDAGLSILDYTKIKTNKKFDISINPILINKDSIWAPFKKIEGRTNTTFSFYINSNNYLKNIGKKYFYRIKEIDTNFLSTTQNFVEINILNKGSYTLELYAINSEESTSNLICMKVLIKPFFYQTNAFKFIMLLLLLAGVYLLIQQIISRTKRKERLKNETELKIMNLELEAWKSNINPHFLFNSLNTLQGIFSNNEFEKANKFMSHFTKTLRKTIENSAKLTTTIEEEITYLKSYLDLEQIKKNNQFCYTIEVDETLSQKFFIPTLVIQPVIENSIVHGIKDSHNGKLNIAFKEADNMIHVIITNNGYPINNKAFAAKEKHGLDLIKNKLAIFDKIYKTTSYFSMDNISNADNIAIGVQTLFKLPIIREATHD